MKFLKNFFLLIGTTLLFYGMVYCIYPYFETNYSLGIWSFYPTLSLVDIFTPPYALPFWLPLQPTGLPLYLQSISWDPLLLLAVFLSYNLAIPPVIGYLTLLCSLSTYGLYRILKSQKIKKQPIYTTMIIYALLLVTLLVWNQIQLMQISALLPFWIYFISRSKTTNRSTYLIAMACLTFLSSTSLPLFPAFLLCILSYLIGNHFYHKKTKPLPFKTIIVLLLASSFYSYLQIEKIQYLSNNYTHLDSIISITNLHSIFTNQILYVFLAVLIFLLLGYYFSDFSSTKNQSASYFQRRPALLIIGIELFILAGGFLGPISSTSPTAHSITLKNQRNTTSDHLDFIRIDPLNPFYQKIDLHGDPVTKSSSPLLYFSMDLNQAFIPTANFQPEQIKLNNYLPFHSLSIKTHTDRLQYLILNQPKSKHWQVRVDNQIRPIYRTAQDLMAIQLNPGSHNITLSYWPGGILHLYIGTIVIFLFCGIICYLQYRSNINIGLFLLFLLIGSMLFPNPPQSMLPFASLKSDKENLEWLLEYEHPDPKWEIKQSQLNIEKAYNGFRSEKLTPSQIYSATLTIPIKEESVVQKLKYTLNVIPEEPVKFAAVLVVKKEGSESHKVDYLEIQDTSKWTTIANSFEIPQNLTAKDSLVFYLWNFDKKCFWVDDIKIQIKK